MEEERLDNTDESEAIAVLEGGRLMLRFGGKR